MASEDRAYSFTPFLVVVLLAFASLQVVADAVRPMVWPMLLRWDGCGWNRNNGMPTQQRTVVEA